MRDQSVTNVCGHWLSCVLVTISEVFSLAYYTLEIQYWSTENFLLKIALRAALRAASGLLIPVQNVNIIMRYYLPESHDFQHIARLPWPDLGSAQRDWVTSVTHMESWLNTNIGGHWQRWAWANATASWEMAVAFRWDRDQCLFLLKWAGSC